MRDGRIGGVWIVRFAERRLGNPLERVIWILHVLEADSAFREIDRRPARAGTERVEVLMDVKIAQRVGRLIDVRDADVAAQYPARLVDRGGDLVRDPLLPVSRIDREWKHG